MSDVFYPQTATKYVWYILITNEYGQSTWSRFSEAWSIEDAEKQIASHFGFKNGSAVLVKETMVQEIALKRYNKSNEENQITN